jgi:hypothetical protein
VHSSRGRPGIDAGSGWKQAICLEFRSDSPVETVPCPFWISEGRIETESFDYDLVPIPFSYAGEARIVLVSGADRFEGAASRVGVYTTGEAVYIEEFPGCER